MVTGLGAYDGALSVANLTEAVRAGALRYLLQVVDVLGKADREVSLATLLLGYNSSANLTVGGLGRGAGARRDGGQRALPRDDATRTSASRRLDIVELYLDTAITAVYCAAPASRSASPHTPSGSRRSSSASAELERGEGARQRLFDAGAGSYWPRLIVTDAADGDETRRAPTCRRPTSAPAHRAAPTRCTFLYVGAARARRVGDCSSASPG